MNEFTNGELVNWPIMHANQDFCSLIRDSSWLATIHELTSHELVNYLFRSIWIQEREVWIHKANHELASIDFSILDNISSYLAISA